MKLGRGEMWCWMHPPPHPPLTQVPVLETADSHQTGRDIYAGAQVGERNTEIPEEEVAEGMILGWEILEGLFLGNTCNEFKNISRLAILWILWHRWIGGGCFAFN